MDFFGSDPGFVSRITSRPGFVNPVQSTPGFDNPVRSKIDEKIDKKQSVWTANDS